MESKLPVSKVAKTASENAFIEAAQSGDTKQLKSYLKKGVNIEVMDKENERTALFWTVRNNKPEALRFLVKAGANIRHKDFRGEHPLIISSRNAPDITCAKILIDSGLPVDLGSKSGTALQTAISEGNINLTRYLLAQGADSSAKIEIDSDDDNKRTVSLRKFALENDQPECASICGYYSLLQASKSNNPSKVKKLLSKGITPDYVIYDAAGKDVKKLFNYRPGRKSPTVYDYANTIAEDNSGTDKLKMMLADFDDTSSDESSDDEVAFIPTEPFVLDREQEKARSERIKEYNAALSSKEEGTPYSAFWGEFSDLRCIVYRGLHYDPKYFSKRKRQAHRKISSNGQPAVSYATQCSAGLATELNINEQHPNLKQAHDDIIKFFDVLKKSKDEKELYASTRNKREFESLYYRFIQAYVENYAQLFTQGNISKHYGYSSDMNPAISTTSLPEKASCYASGVRMEANHYLNPHYRRYTLKPKHPYVGVVFAYSFDLEYFFKKGCFVLDHVFNGRLGIGHIKQFEYEVLFESLIPGKFQIDKELYVFPSFSEWSDSHGLRFGYTKQTFSNDKNKLISLDSEENKLKARRDFLESVNDRVQKGLAGVLEFRVKSSLAGNSKPCWIAFPFKDKTLSEAAESPKKKEKWREDVDGDPNQILSPMANLAIDRKKKIYKQGSHLPTLFRSKLVLDAPTLQVEREDNEDDVVLKKPTKKDPKK